MDGASLLGSVSGVVLIIWAIMLNGDLAMFWDLPAAMIVIGGTIAATLVSFNLTDVLSAFRAAGIVFTHRTEDANDMIETMIEISNISRKQGLISLSKLEIESAFLKKACNLIADGSKENVLRDTLMIEIESLKQRHFIVQDIFRKMANSCPAFGMCGTLIGLVEMLASLQDAAKIGPAMSVALVTTFYGAFLANMVFTPIAAKLKARTITEVINLEIMFEGAISILDNNNPLMVYEKLSSYIPNKLRRPMQSKVLKK